MISANQGTRLLRNYYSEISLCLEDKTRPLQNKRDRRLRISPGNVDMSFLFTDKAATCILSHELLSVFVGSGAAAWDDYSIGYVSDHHLHDECQGR